MKIQNNRRSAAVAALGLLLAFSPSVFADSFDEARRVGHVRWDKERGVAAGMQEREGRAGVYFFRLQDKDVLQTSANVAINDRFQVSLQPGNYSQVYTCVGVNRISSQITGHKSNNLLFNAVDYRLESGRNYYFDVDVDTDGRASVKRISAEEAQQLMDKMPRQNHQISRVLTDCVEQPQEKINIRLEILFDTDKSNVKQHFYSEVQRVADYMQRFPDAVVMLEGHTDDRASDRYNQQLSQRRVDEVKRVLVNHFGIQAARISTVGYGEARPVADNGTEEGRRLNRRVIAVFETR